MTYWVRFVVRMTQTLWRARKLLLVGARKTSRLIRSIRQSRAFSVYSFSLFLTLSFTHSLFPQSRISSWPLYFTLFSRKTYKTYLWVLNFLNIFSGHFKFGLLGISPMPYHAYLHLQFFSASTHDILVF